MKQHPILFSGEMVRAIFEGRKTQTRRIIKMRDGSLCESECIPAYEGGQRANYVMDYSKTFPQWEQLDCPYGQIGDQLWVREKWQAQNTNGQWWHEVRRDDRLLWNWAWTNPVRPAYDEMPKRWLPGIHMPRMACRITLEIVTVRVERVQEISSQDATAEGVYPSTHGGVVGAFAHLWRSINADDGKRWEDNPWVWVVEFKVL